MAALTDAWPGVLSGLDDDGSTSPSQRAFLALSRPIGLIENTVLLAVQDDFARSQIEGRLRSLLSAALSKALAADIQIAVTVDAEAAKLAGMRETDSSESESIGSRPGDRRPAEHADGRLDARLDMRTPVDRTEGSALTGSSVTRARDADLQVAGDEVGGRDSDTTLGRFTVSPSFRTDIDRTQPLGSPRRTQPRNDAEPARLNPKYTFDTFVIGSSNRFAHAAAVAVAEAPAKAYNPLFIYGESGLGKTHLLHAIGHYARNLYAGARVRYVSSEEFTNDFINSIRDDKASAFQRRYRDIDVLLVDDIQFLAGKVQTQEEFFHTFNTLHNADKQIVVTSDQPPKLLQAFEDRMRSRFEWGLITDVQPPDLETRIAILRKKAAQERLSAPDDALEYIASKIATNIRELEGALIRVTAFASLNKQQVDMGLAELVLKDLITESGVPEITASMIMAQTAQFFDVSIDDLCSANRSRVLVTARQISMYLCRELTELSLPKIGQQFGGRDHTTVMHADRKIRLLMGERRAIFNQVTELTNRIKQQARHS